tara:strand:- start:437 stop:547 length:111 start_codon:yes stop_codon:yes gene_type:complete
MLGTSPLNDIFERTGLGFLSARSMLEQQASEISNNK